METSDSLLPELPPDLETYPSSTIEGIGWEAVTRARSILQAQGEAQQEQSLPSAVSGRMVQIREAYNTALHSEFGENDVEHGSSELFEAFREVLKEHVRKPQESSSRRGWPRKDKRNFRLGDHPGKGMIGFKER